MSTEATQLQLAKRAARAYHQAMDGASAATVLDVLQMHMSDNTRFVGVHPFNELQGPREIAEVVWQPLMRAWRGLVRRPDIFMAGRNQIDGTIWVMSMGHLMGLFDQPWLDIPPTRKIALLRYAEFLEIKDQKIGRVGLFFDLIDVMMQAGHNPLPEQTGARFTYPGPVGHDGILSTVQRSGETQKTMALVEQMILDLSQMNESGDDSCPPEILRKTWHEDMIWYGPAGIGAAYTIPRYQEQHQIPFRRGLKGKVFNGHVCRFAEGNFACFFGWPNLTNTPRGGFLGLPGNEARCDMRVVDVYRRAGDKLSENWVLIDLPYWLKQQGLDIFDRLRTRKSGARDE